MKILALHAKAGAGKDTFADALVNELGFVKRGFADPLYEEVAYAFRVGVEWLRDRSRKETPQDLLRVVRCYDAGFRAWAEDQGHYLTDMRSPRWILQRWGTEYRRAQADDYWTLQMERFATRHSGLVDGIAIPDCRFVNEATWVQASGGKVVRIVRPGLPEVEAHASEAKLAIAYLDAQVVNDGSLSHFRSVAISTTRHLLGIPYPHESA